MLGARPAVAIVWAGAVVSGGRDALDDDANDRHPILQYLTVANDPDRPWSVVAVAIVAPGGSRESVADRLAERIRARDLSVLRYPLALAGDGSDDMARVFDWVAGERRDHELVVFGERWPQQTRVSMARASVQRSLEAWLVRVDAPAKAAPYRVERLAPTAPGVLRWTTELDGVWGLSRARSPALRALHERIESYGPHPFPVLILGPRGAGKTAVAETLRERWRLTRASARLGAKWPHRVNCASLRGDLVASELFGHERGAFTGAQRARAGLLERADGDCAFLDEVHHLDPGVQAQLLTAVERGGWFFRVGSDAPVAAGFRLIAASNQPLAALRDRLAEDFLDRISACVLRIPPLSECAEDLEEIWTNVVAGIARQAVAGLVEPSEEARVVAATVRTFAPAWTQFRDRDLPGNWRDLQRGAVELVTSSLRIVDGGCEVVPAHDPRTVLAPLYTAASASEPRADLDAPPSLDTLDVDELWQRLLPPTDHVAALLAALCSRGWSAPSGAAHELASRYRENLAEAAIAAAGSIGDGATLLGLPKATLSGWRPQR